MNAITTDPVLLIAVTLVAIGMVVYLATAQFLNPNNSFSPIDVRDGGGLYKKQLSCGNEACVQIIDVPKRPRDQLIGETERIGIDRGLYYQG